MKQGVCAGEPGMSVRVRPMMIVGKGWPVSKHRNRNRDSVISLSPSDRLETGRQNVLHVWVFHEAKQPNQDAFWS